MIITRLSGGLGNQLFQYACGRALSEKNNDALLIDVTGYGAPATPKLPFVEHITQRTFGLSHFAITAPIATQEQVQQAKNPHGLFSKVIRAVQQKVLKKYHIDFHPEIMRMSTVGKTVYLDGYFQSELYFVSIRSILLSEFRLSEALCPAAQQWVDTIGTSSPSVSLHIRRGDYAQDPKTLALHGLTPLTYYHEAIALLRTKYPNCVFYVFSDEITWARENLKSDADLRFVSHPELTEYEELHLMTLCTHNIIANSTFSWWGAWLGTSPSKEVIAPGKWTNSVPDDHPNIIPTTWTRL